MNSIQRVIGTSRHQELAQAWAQYNSASGRTTAKAIAQVMAQLSEADLTRMLAERGIRVMALSFSVA